MALGFVLFVVTIVALFAVVAVLVYLHERRRREALEALAARRGWIYQARDDSRRAQRYEGFRPFGVGGARRVRDVIVGSVAGRPFEAFDYVYTTSNGKQTQTHRFKVAVAQMPLDGHGLAIEPEHLGHKLFDALGGEDIDFESDEFSRRFWVRAQDRRFAYDVLHPAMMQWFLGTSPRWAWQWRGSLLVLHAPGSLDAAAVERLAADAEAFQAALPRHRLAHP